MPTKVHHNPISSVRHRASNSCLCRSATSVFSASTKRRQVDQRWIDQMFDWMWCDFTRIACSVLHSRHLPLCLKCLHNLSPLSSVTHAVEMYRGTCLLPSQATIFPHSLYKTCQKDMPSDCSPLCVDCVPRTYAAYSRFECAGQSGEEQSVLKLNRERIPRKPASRRVPHQWNSAPPTHSGLSR